jgi:pimeloyl-ACP methyl ester carboxylesterase
VFYREAGPVDAPTIVLLHGFPSSSHLFRELIPALSKSFHLVAPDYPGFGQSDSPSIQEFDYRFDRLADVVEHFLQALGLKRFSLYMQDYGAPIGFRLATRHPEWIQALIVQNGNAYEEGITAAFEPLKPFWAERNATTEAAARALLQKAERESPGHSMPGMNRRSFEGGEEREMRPRKALDEKRLA